MYIYEKVYQRNEKKKTVTKNEKNEKDLYLKRQRKMEANTSQ